VSLSLSLSFTHTNLKIMIMRKVNGIQANKSLNEFLENTNKQLNEIKRTTENSIKI
jgi:hypothetical protein